MKWGKGQNGVDANKVYLKVEVGRFTRCHVLVDLWA